MPRDVDERGPLPCDATPDEVAAAEEEMRIAMGIDEPTSRDLGAGDGKWTIGDAAVNALEAVK